MATLAACEEDAVPESTETPSEGRIRVEVQDTGYSPERVSVAAGQPVTLVFRRVSESPCGETLVIPSENIERDLPLNEDVEVTVTPDAAGEIAFACGMDMMRGTIVVTPES